MGIIFPCIKIERWKYNKEYEIYVSNMGHFRDKSKTIITPFVIKGGYLAVFCKRVVQAHRLVMLTWRPITGAEHFTVDHLDHNKRNNCLDNLEWISEEENRRRGNRDHLDPEKVYEAMFNFAFEDVERCKEKNADKKVVAINPWTKTKSPVFIYPDMKNIDEVVSLTDYTDKRECKKGLIGEIGALFSGTNAQGWKKAFGIQLILV